METTRYDFTPIKAELTKDGYLLDSPIVARVGIQTYMNADGSVRKELRLPEDVFDAESLSSFAGKPLTDDHPSEAVSSKNFKKYAIGVMTGPAYQDDDNVRVPLILHDAEAVDKAIKGGKRELSVGYSVVLDETPGVYQGEAYSARQTKIRVNHLSLVKRGRAGNARLTLDGASCQVSETPEKELSMSDNLGRIRLDTGLEYQASPEVIQAFEKMRDDKAIHKTNMDELQKQLDTVAAERDALKHDAANLATVKADALESARKEVKARADLEVQAASFKVDCKDKTDREVKEAVIKSVRADVDLTGKSEDYVAASFDFAVAQKADNAMAEQRKAGVKLDSTDKKVESKTYKGFMAALGNKE